MRRAALMLLAAAVATAVLIGAGGEAKDHKVAGIFSHAAGLIPGQNVQIAGAVVGTVDTIKLTPDHRALVVMKVKTGFVPFRADAECEIKPQSLIGEKFVQCDPGSPDAGALRERDGLPTVPLSRTRAPVDIDLVFAALREPYVNRLSLLVNELGVGVAGRPADLQAAIRRAAPALGEFDRVLRIVNRDRDLLGNLIDRTDTVLAQVTPRERDITRFVDRASRAATDVAQRRDALGQALDRLPPLLAELEPSAQSLAGVARDARPVVQQLRAATPSLRDLFGDLAPLTQAGRPAFAALRSASDEGRKAVAAARPVARKLRRAASLLPHVGKVTAAVTGSLRKTGAVEAINTFAWLGTASMARFDSTSHIVPSYQVGGSCNQYATKPVDGCSAHWAGSPAAEGGGPVAPPSARRRSAGPKERRAHAPTTRSDSGSTPAAGSPRERLPAVPKLPELPPLPDLPGVGKDDDAETARQLLDFLFGR